MILKNKYFLCCLEWLDLTTAKIAHSVKKSFGYSFRCLGDILTDNSSSHYISADSHTVDRQLLVYGNNKEKHKFIQ